MKPWKKSILIKFIKIVCYYKQIHLNSVWKVIKFKWSIKWGKSFFWERSFRKRCVFSFWEVKKTVWYSPPRAMDISLSAYSKFHFKHFFRDWNLHSFLSKFQRAIMFYMQKWRISKETWELKNGHRKRSILLASCC